MSDFNHDIKLVKVNNNHILATDANNKVVATNITVQELTAIKQDSFKRFFIDLADEVDLDPVNNPTQIEKFQSIVDNITMDSNQVITSIPLIFFYINDIKGYVPTRTYIDKTTYTLYIVANYLTSTTEDTITDTTTTVKEYYCGIEIKLDEHFEEVVYTKYKASIAYDSKTYDYLSTQSTLNGNSVTYVPQKDGQPANKKYVDAQDSALDTRITALETATTNIGNRLDAINGEVIS